MPFLQLNSEEDGSHFRRGDSGCGMSGCITRDRTDYPWSPHSSPRCAPGELSGFFSHRGQSSQLLSAGVEPPWQAGSQSTGRDPFLPTVTRAGTEMQSKDCDSELGEALGSLGFLGGSVVKNAPASVGDLDLIPGSGRTPREGSGNLFQYSCLENPMDQRGLSGYGPWGCKESMHAHTRGSLA